MATSETELAWLAGLLEGEGSFFLHRTRPSGAKRDYYYPTIVVTMTDADVIQRAARAMECPSAVRTIAPAGVSKKTGYRAVLRGAAAVRLMRALLPMMGVRRSSKIVELLAYDAARPATATARRESCAAAVVGRSRDSRGRLT